MQRDFLSTIPFNQVLEVIIRYCEINETGSIFNDDLQCLEFANGLILTAKSKREL